MCNFREQVDLIGIMIVTEIFDRIGSPQILELVGLLSAIAITP